MPSFRIQNAYWFTGQKQPSEPNLITLPELFAQAGHEFPPAQEFMIWVRWHQAVPFLRLKAGWRCGGETANQPFSDDQEQVRVWLSRLPVPESSDQMWNRIKAKYHSCQASVPREAKLQMDWIVDCDLPAFAGAGDMVDRERGDRPIMSVAHVKKTSGDREEITTTITIQGMMRIFWEKAAAAAPRPGTTPAPVLDYRDLDLTVVVTDAQPMRKFDGLAAVDFGNTNSVFVCLRAGRNDVANVESIQCDRYADAKDIKLARDSKDSALPSVVRIADYRETAPRESDKIPLATWTVGTEALSGGSGALLLGGKRLLADPQQQTGHPIVLGDRNEEIPKDLPAELLIAKILKEFYCSEMSYPQPIAVTYPATFSDAEIERTREAVVKALRRSTMQPTYWPKPKPKPEGQAAARAAATPGGDVKAEERQLVEERARLLDKWVPRRFMLDEATAAAFHFLYRDFIRGPGRMPAFYHIYPNGVNILLYDCGGGTTDISLIHCRVYSEPQNAPPRSVPAAPPAVPVSPAAVVQRRPSVVPASPAAAVQTQTMPAGARMPPAAFRAGFPGAPPPPAAGQAARRAPDPPPGDAWRIDIRVLGRTGHRDFGGDNITEIVFVVLKALVARLVARLLGDAEWFVWDEGLRAGCDKSHASAWFENLHKLVPTPWMEETTQSTAQGARRMRLMALSNDERTTRREVTLRFWEWAEKVKRSLSELAAPSPDEPSETVAKVLAPTPEFRELLTSFLAARHPIDRGALEDELSEVWSDPFLIKQWVDYLVEPDVAKTIRAANNMIESRLVEATRPASKRYVKGGELPDDSVVHWVYVVGKSSRYSLIRQQLMTRLAVGGLARRKENGSPAMSRMRFEEEVLKTCVASGAVLAALVSRGSPDVKVDFDSDLSRRLPYSVGFDSANGPEVLFKENQPYHKLDTQCLAVAANRQNEATLYLERQWPGDEIEAIDEHGRTKWEKFMRFDFPRPPVGTIKVEYGDDPQHRGRKTFLMTDMAPGGKVVVGQELAERAYVSPPQRGDL